MLMEQRVWSWDLIVTNVYVQMVTEARIVQVGLGNLYMGREQSNPFSIRPPPNFVSFEFLSELILMNKDRLH